VNNDTARRSRLTGAPANTTDGGVVGRYCEGPTRNWPSTLPGRDSQSFPPREGLESVANSTGPTCGDDGPPPTVTNNERVLLLSLPPPNGSVNSTVRPSPVS